MDENATLKARLLDLLGVVQEGDKEEVSEQVNSELTEERVAEMIANALAEASQGDSDAEGEESVEEESAATLTEERVGELIANAMKDSGAIRRVEKPREQRDNKSRIASDAARIQREFKAASLSNFDRMLIQNNKESE